MKNLNNLLKAKNCPEVILGIVFIIYILLNVNTPSCSIATYRYYNGKHCSCCYCINCFR